MRQEQPFAAVLASAQRGDDAAVAELFRRYNRSLLAYLRAHERAEGEDLCAEVWLAVARGLAKFTGNEGDFRAWLFTIARRRLVDHHRRGMRRPTVAVPPEGFDELGATVAPAAEDVVLPGLAGEAARERIMRLLPPDQADVVLLRVVAGLDVAEVARILGKRPGTVRVLQHRALRRLALILGAQVATP